MNTKKLFTLLSTGALIIANAQQAKDIEAIKAMAGCYEVRFNFAETFSPDKSYEKKDNYTSRALEWITVAEESPKEIKLQHLLIVNPKGKDKNAIVKHWRQDWKFENTDFYTFDRENKWKFKKLDPKSVKGQWSQIVYQVDDAPRYAGSGTWIHLDGKTYWESSADAPLPRREYTKRNDYNVLNRTNKHEIYDWGWLHNQDNKKIMRAEGKPDEILVEEKGNEIYKKVDNGKCLLAQNYWNEYSGLWASVRKNWDNRLKENKDLEVKPNVSDIYLYEKLWDLKPTQTKEAEKAVKEFIIK